MNVLEYVHASCIWYMFQFDFIYCKVHAHTSLYFSDCKMFPTFSSPATLAGSRTRNRAGNYANTHPSHTNKQTTQHAHRALVRLLLLLLFMRKHGANMQAREQTIFHPPPSKTKNATTTCWGGDNELNHNYGDRPLTYYTTYSVQHIYHTHMMCNEGAELLGVLFDRNLTPRHLWIVPAMLNYQVALLWYTIYI